MPSNSTWTVTASAMLAGAVVLLAACIDPAGPTLCLFPAGQLGGGAALPASCKSPADLDDDHEAKPDDAKHKDCIAVDDNEAFFIRHRLPDGIEVAEPLKVTIDSPCGTTKLEAAFVRGEVLLPRVAPPGAGCKLLVRTTILNSELACDTGPVVREDGTDPCADIDQVCADSTN